MLVIYLGIVSIRVLLNIKAPLLVILGLVLLGWAYRTAVHGFGPMLSRSRSAFDAGSPRREATTGCSFPAMRDRQA